MTYDKRNVSRKGLRAPAVLRLSAGERQEALTVDVGLDGMSLATATPFAPDTLCTVEFALPVEGDSCTLRLQARVIYSRPHKADGFRIGIKFLARSWEARATLALFAVR